MDELQEDADERHGSDGSMNMAGISAGSLLRESHRSSSISAPTAGDASNFLPLNVGGWRFNLYPTGGLSRQSHLQTLLAADHTRRYFWADTHNSDTGEYVFHRSGSAFRAIVDWHYTGRLHCPHDLCRHQFAEELSFWGVSPMALAACCSDPALPAVASVPNPFNRLPPAHANHIGDAISEGPDENDYPSHVRNKLGQDPWSWRERLWDFLENPSDSMLGKIFALCSVSFILVSIIGLVLGSIPELQDEKGEPVSGFMYLEIVCIAWFTSEYALRLLSAPNKWAFIKAPLNVVDLITILPFYLELVVSLAETNSDEAGKKDGGESSGWGVENLKGMLLVMRILRVLRVARLFKLARYSSGLQSFAKVFSASVAELGMLFMFLLVANLFFSTIVYFLEKEEKDEKGRPIFTSIPHTAWWCIITMTTVGYGDIVPVTIGGRLVASLASISGVLVLAFPITMIVDNFSKHYETKSVKSHSNKGGRRQSLAPSHKLSRQSSIA